MYLYIYPSSVYSLIAKNKNEMIQTRLAVLRTLGSPGYDTWLLSELSSKGVVLSFLCGLTAKKEWRFSKLGLRCHADNVLWWLGFSLD